MFAVTVKNAPEAQFVKLAVTCAGAVPPGAMSPANCGMVLTTVGLHAVPDVCTTVKLVTWAPKAAPGPLLPMLTVHTRSPPIGPVFVPKLPPIYVVPAKSAVIVAAPIRVTTECEMAPPSLHLTQAYCTPLVCGDVVAILLLLPGTPWQE